MQTKSNTFDHHGSVASRFTLNRILILLLAGGFMGLMVDIRVEHVEAVRTRTVAWIPIVYSAFMAMSCTVVFLVWNKMIRRAVLPLFVLAFLVGALGFYFHNHGNVRKVITTSVQAWTDDQMQHPDGPPQFAPLAFAGLGMIGLLASIRRFDS